jgi:cytochrome c553
VALALLDRARHRLDQVGNLFTAADNPQMVAPILRGQDKDYLVMALRAYRDDKRESTTMHKMSVVYSNAIIDDLASHYASQPRKAKQ